LPTFASAARAATFLLGFAAIAGLAGCQPEPQAATSARLRVVATTGMIADLAAEVGGERVEVHGLMGPGVDPHLYKASAGDVRVLAAADLILFNGLHLEAAMGEVLEELGGRTAARAVTDSIDRSRLLAPPEFKGMWDPHVWFDVELWMAALDAVAQALSERDPAGGEIYARNAASYRGRLAELDRWVEARAAQLPAERRVLITAHDAFNYFGRAYGFEVLGLQGISTAAEAGAADVKRLVDFIVERRIPAVFVETSIPQRTIEAVLEAVRDRGFEVAIGGSLYSDAMGDAGTPQGTYEGMIRHNVGTIVGGLLAEREGG
jgi:manganese/zinc/iron transport system substrate-binding protein